MTSETRHNVADDEPRSRSRAGLVRTVALLALVAGLTSAVIAVIHRSHADREAAVAQSLQTPRLEVVAETVDPQPGYERERRFTGLIAPRRSVDLGFQGSGQVTEVLADLGDKVTRDQVLARLDIRRNSARLNELQASLAEAQANLTLAVAEEKRQDSLADREVATLRSLDQAVNARRTAEARVQAVSAQIETLKIELADSELKAPFDAVVAERRIERSSIVSAGSLAYRLLETGAPEAQFGVPLGEANQLKPGSEVLVVRGADELAGRVRAIVPEVAGGTRTATVVVALDTDAEVTSGEAVQLSIRDFVAVDGFWLPADALVSGVRGLWAVQIVTGPAERSEVGRAPVEVLHTAGGRSFVRGALQPGDRVITKGTHRVSPGQAVSIKMPGGAEAAMSSILFNPRIFVLATGFLIVLGITAIENLPRQEDPTIQSRSATVLTFYPGADAERVEALVTKPIEDELRTLADVQTIESTSRAGTSVITVELLPTIFDTARVWSRVRDKLSDVTPRLPSGATPPNLDDERGYAYTLLAAVRWTAPGEPNPVIIRRFALELQDRLRNVPGTDYVKLHGSTAERIDVILDPNALAAAGLAIDAVSRSLTNADVRSSAGQLIGASTRLTVELGGAFGNVDRLLAVPIAAENGRTLKLSDVAIIRRGLEDPPSEIALIDGARAIAVGSRMQPSQRVDLWVERAEDAVNSLRNEAPQGLSIEVVFEQSGYTTARLGTVVTSLVQGLMIVVAVLLVTMGWRSALIVGFAIPMTALLTLGLFRPFGIDIHQMSVTGLIVALGLMVDNAIIVTNDIRDRAAKGENIRKAAVGAIRSLWAPLFASTATTILAFMPIVLLPGTAGEFVGPLAIAVIIALISSYAVALFFVPALTPALFGKPQANLGWIQNGISLPWLNRAFRTLLRASLRQPLVSIAFALSLPVIGVASMPTVKQVFFPPADRDQFHLTVRLAPSAAIAETERLAREIDAVIKDDAEVARTFWFLGASAPTLYYNVLATEDANPAFAQAIVNTVSDDATTRIIPRLQTILNARFPQVEIQVFKYEQGPPVMSPIEVRIIGQDLAILADLGQQVSAILSNVPSVTHARALLTRDEPKLKVLVAEDEANLAGLDLTAVAGQLDAALAGRSGGFILEGTEQMPIRVRYPDDLRADPAKLDTLPVTVAGAPDGSAGLPLSAVSRAELVPSWSGIQHRNGQRLQIVRGYIQTGVIPSDVTARFRAALDASGFEVPSGYRIEFGGEEAERSEAVGLLLGSVAMLIVLMITTVALTFNSFRMTAIVFLAGIQTLGVGLLSLKLTGFAFGFIIIVGIMGLVGVAINATIMILSAFRSDERAARGEIGAMVDILSGPVSRHIWSTTITTVGGFVPLMLAPGEFWPPFAQTVAGGLMLATAIAFFFTPAAWRLVAPRSKAAQPIAALEPAAL